MAATREPRETEDPEINIVKLRIQMHTNKDTIDELTADKFMINTKINGTFPFLCTNYRYSKELLNYKSLEERVELFFNYTKFINFVIASKLKKTKPVLIVSQKIVDIDTKITELFDKIKNEGSPITNSQDIMTEINAKPNIYSKEQILEGFSSDKKFKDNDELYKYLQNLSKKNDVDNSIIKENIIIMLNAIFPISFPIKDQISSMYDSSNIDFVNIAKQLFTPNEYVYLNIGKICTVTQVIWLNTISSNPVYYELYRKITKYYKMVLKYIDKNIKDDILVVQYIDGKNIKGDKQSIANIIESSSNDSDKISEIKKNLEAIFSVYLNTENRNKRYNIKYKNPNEEDEEYPPKKLFILYYLITNLKDKEKNNFNRLYVTKYVTENTSGNPYYSNQDTFYETKFLDSLKESKDVDIDFYKQYHKDIDNNLSPYRISTVSEIASSLNNTNLSNSNSSNTNGNYTKFIDLIKKHGKTFSGIDKVKDKEADLYEIHIGLGLVGGKVTQSNYIFSCNYASHRLGNLMNYLIKNTKENEEHVRLYNYIDLENIKDTTEYVGIINSNINQSKQKKDNKPINNYGTNRGGRKTRRKYHHRKRKTQHAK